MFQTTNQVCMKEPRKNRGLKNGLGNVNHLRFVGCFSDQHRILGIALPRCSMVLEYLPTKLGNFWVNVGIHIPAPWFASGLWSCQASLNHSYLRIINHSYWSYKPTEHYRTLVLPSISLTGHPPHSSQLDSQVVVYHPDRRFLFAMAVCVYIM